MKKAHPDITLFQFPRPQEHHCHFCNTPLRHPSFWVNAHGLKSFEPVCETCRPRERERYPSGCEPFSAILFATPYGWLDVRGERIRRVAHFRQLLRLLPIASRTELCEQTVWNLRLEDFTECYTMQDVVEARTPIEKIPGVLWGGLHLGLGAAARAASRFWRRSGVSLRGRRWGRRQAHIRPFPILCLMLFNDDGRTVASLDIARIDRDAYYLWATRPY